MDQEPNSDPAAPGTQPDKYLSFNFAVSVPERVVSAQLAWFQECSGLEIATETLNYSGGGNPNTVFRLPTRHYYPNLVLRRGVADSTALLDWFLANRDKPQRDTIRITMYAGNKVQTQFSFLKAHPVGWRGPFLQATGAHLVIEEIEIAHEGISVDDA